MSFWSEALPYAKEAHNSTGVLTSVILAQWVSENGRQWPPPYNNPGNVNDTQHGGQQGFPTLQAGVNAYVSTMLLGYYTGVRHAVGYVAQAEALGRSPWAAAHYVGNAPFNYPGGLLIALIQENNLTQYDAPAPPPAPPTPPPPVAPPVVTNYPGVSVQSVELTLPSALDGNGNGYFSAPALGISSVNAIVSVSWITTVPATSGYAKLPTNWGIDASDQLVITGGSPNGRYGCIIWTTD